MNHPLAIVVPAYKAAHLRQALASIAAQTDQRFRVYVGDDASPEPIAPLVAQCGLPADRLVYHRFPANLGGTSLIQQWDRCIRLSSEPWVWLFSDDDEMEPGCVAAFYARLEETKAAYDYYRFNAIVIDEHGLCTALCPPHPPWESARAYAYFFLRGVRRATQQEAVFRRQAYERIGGIIELPLAWYADTAFGVACSRERGVCTIPGPVVRFRLSGGNISSTRGALRDRQKWDALMIFLAAMKRFVLETSSTTEYPTDAMMLPLLHQRFLRGVRNANRWIGPAELRKFRAFLRENFPATLRRDTLRLLKYNVQVLPKLAAGWFRRS